MQAWSIRRNALRGLGVPHQHVCRAAIAGDPLGRVRDVVAVFDQQVCAEHAREPSERVELLLLLSCRVVVGDPQQVELGAEPLRGAPRAANDPLRLRLRLDERQQSLADRLRRGGVDQPLVL